MSEITSMTLFPPELLVSVLSQLQDEEELQNLAMTCRAIYETFDQNRQAILVPILNKTIHLQCGVAVEADACLLAADIRSSGKNLLESGLREFLDDYRTRRAQQLAPDQCYQKLDSIVFYTGKTRSQFEVRKLEPDPIKTWLGPMTDLASLDKLWIRHNLIRRCVKRFCRETLATERDRSLDEERFQRRSAPLSPVECRRLYRAFYCVELYHQIYHGYRGKRAVCQPDARNMPDFLWLCTFPPHECEEMATVYQWLDDGWREKFKDLDTDLGTWQKRQLYVDEGLEGYLKVSAENDICKLREISVHCRSKPEEELIYLGTCLITNSPFHDANGVRSFHDGYLSMGARIRFTGDHVHYPNYGWIWSHKFRMTGYICHYSQSGLRRLGHVMWDKSRLDTWEIYEALAPKLSRIDWHEEDGSWWLVIGADGPDPWSSSEYSSEDDDDDDADF